MKPEQPNIKGFTSLQAVHFIVELYERKLFACDFLPVAISTLFPSKTHVWCTMPSEEPSQERADVYIQHTKYQKIRIMIA